MRRLRQAMLVAAMMVVAATATAEPTRKWGRIGSLQVMLKIPDRFSEELKSALIVAPAVTTGPVSFGAIVDDDNDGKPAGLMLMFEHSKTEQKAFACGRVALLADGRLYAQVDASPATQKPSDEAAGTIVEVVDIRVPREVMLRMASAKLVEAQVCKTEVVFVSDFQRAIAAMYEALDTGVLEDAPGSEGSGNSSGPFDFKSLGLGL